MPPVRTAVVDDHEIDVAGVGAVLRRFASRIVLVEDLDDQDGVDVILYGMHEQQDRHDTDLHLLLREHAATVIVLGWDEDPSRASWALSCGAHGRLSKTMTGEQIVGGLESIHGDRDRTTVPPLDGRCHPGLLSLGLTPRELEVLTRITQGLSNQEIADEIYISINSVKTYVRTAYRKIGAKRRSQAVSWGIQHGLDVTTSARDALAAPVA